MMPVLEIHMCVSVVPGASADSETTKKDPWWSAAADGAMSANQSTSSSKEVVQWGRTKEAQGRPAAAKCMQHFLRVTKRLQLSAGQWA